MIVDRTAPPHLAGALGSIPARATLGLAARKAFAAAIVAVLYTNAAGFGSNVSAMPGPAFFIGAAAAAAAVLCLLQPWRVVELARSPFVWWAGAWFAVVSIWAFGMSDVAVYANELADRYRSVVVMLSLAVLLQEKEVRRVALYTLAACVVFGCLVHVAEAARLIEFPIDDPDRIAGRSGGLYGNPNDAAINLLFGLALSMAALPRTLRIPLLLATATGIVLTFSRGTAITFALLLVVVLATRVIRAGPTAIAALAALALVVGFSGELQQALESAGVLNTNTWMRLHFATNDSSNERVRLAETAWGLFARSPLTGAGFGSTFEWELPERPHNTFLFLAADYGITGLLLLPALGVALLRRSRATLPFVAVLMLTGIFNHNLMTEISLVVLIAIAGSGAAHEIDPDPGARAAA